MSPQVSVVITAHDRKEFLKGAVQSVIDQDADRSEFEIIVVKNFHDDEIDSFLERNNVISVFTSEKSFGAKISSGIDRSTGEIITFLDDDDLFARDRISTLMEEFSDENVVYHHSSIITIDSEGNEYEEGLSDNIPQTIGIRDEDIPWNYSIIMKYKGHWYTSTISCRASPLRKYSVLIHSISASIDKTLFLVCLESGGKFVLDSRPLTKYRVHTSVTTQVTDYETLMQKRESFYKRSLNVLEKLSLNLKEQRTKDVLRAELIHGKLLVSFFTKDPEYRVGTGTLISYLFLGLIERMRIISFWSAANLSARIFPSYTKKRYYRKMTDEFKKFKA